MNDKINIKGILKKHTSINSEESWGRNGKFEITNYKAAIKEIVEAAIDKCANEAEAIEGYNTGFSGSAASVDKESILKVKEMIDYE